jgi:hypothetical protein
MRRSALGRGGESRSVRACPRASRGGSGPGSVSAFGTSRSSSRCCVTNAGNATRRGATSAAHRAASHSATPPLAGFQEVLRCWVRIPRADCRRDVVKLPPRSVLLLHPSLACVSVGGRQAGQPAVHLLDDERATWTSLARTRPHEWNRSATLRPPNPIAGPNSDTCDLTR